MTTRFPFVVLALLLSFPVPARGEPVSSRDAARHLGETVTVCGPVAGAAHFSRIQGEPTFLNFDRAYPEQTFTAVIWGRDNDKFEQPPHRLFAGKDLCVTGRIETYRGRPQIVVTDPGQITVAAPEFDSDRFSYEERVFLKSLLCALGHEIDMGSGDWDEEAETALLEFQSGAGIAGGEGRDARTLRALAEAAASISPEDRTRVLRLLLLNLAQREEAALR
jgi:hypothetical protein